MPGSGSSAAPNDAALEARLAGVEQALGALGEALRLRDPVSIEAEAHQLHHALGAAVDDFMRAARRGDIPQALRHRLAQAGRDVALQRDSLNRASFVLDRALQTLVPAEQVLTYGGGAAGFSAPTYSR
jgi:hypothetical protein